MSLELLEDLLPRHSDGGSLSVVDGSCVDGVCVIVVEYEEVLCPT